MRHSIRTASLRAERRSVSVVRDDDVAFEAAAIDFSAFLTGIPIACEGINRSIRENRLDGAIADWTEHDVTPAERYLALSGDARRLYRIYRVR